MHLNEKNLLKVLDMLVERPTWAVCAKSIGVSERILYEWRNKSIAARKANDTSSPLYLIWRGVPDFWDMHCRRARVEQLFSTEHVIRDQAQNGVEEKIFGPDQKPIWKQRLKYIGRDDNFVRVEEGLDEFESVEWYRLEHDQEGNPIQQTKIVQLAAPLRKAVLSASHPDYRESLDVSVQHSGVVHISKPLERLASEPRAPMEELRRLAAMSSEERRAKTGASVPALIPAISRGVPDPAPTPKPSYAKPVRPLDRGEGIGRGNPPEGGAPAHGPGMVR